MKALSIVALAALAACGGYATMAPYGGGGGGGGGPVGAVAVGTNGQIVFVSAHNGSANPAVDTVAVGGAVTWTWTNNGGISHSIQSLGSTAFTSSPTKSANGQTYAVTFTTPGTYQYDCAVHGTAMSGTVVVR